MYNIKEERIKVYISSPYTNGDQLENTRRQMDLTDELMNEGFYPFTPLYSHFQHKYKPRAYEDWIDVDLVWVEVCDCFLRIKPIVNGKEILSKGADIEEAEAKKLGIPIFYSIKDLVGYYKKGEN
jgi:hypothetical protein